MAEPFDAATFLMDVSALLQTEYMPNFVEQSSGRFGHATNMFFQPHPELAFGDGLTMQYEFARADNVRSAIDPNGAIASPSSLIPGSIRFRFNDVNPTSANHDFTQLTASVQNTESAIANAGKQSIVDFVERVYNQVSNDYEEKLAFYRNYGRNAVFALVNGTPTLNNSWYLAGATGTATNAGGIRTAVDTGSISYFQPGRRVDFINLTTGAVIAGNIRVTDNNTTDSSFGGEFVTSGTSGDLSTGNLASVADNYGICPSGAYNTGLYSMGAYFTRPTAGESFVGGVDRSTASYRWMLPVSTREGAASALLTQTMFDDVAEAMSFKSEDPDEGMGFNMNPKNTNRLRREIGEAGFMNIPNDDTRLKRFANFGSFGLNYQHAQFGMVKIMSDPIMPESSVRILNNKTWKTLFWGHKGLIPIKEGGQHWYRMNASAPNTGKSLVRKADWYCNIQDVCTQPWKNAQILNIAV